MDKILKKLQDVLALRDGWNDNDRWIYATDDVVVWYEIQEVDDDINDFCYEIYPDGNNDWEITYVERVDHGGWPEVIEFEPKGDLDLIEEWLDKILENQEVPTGI